MAVCVKHLRFYLCKVMYLGEGGRGHGHCQTHVNKTPIMTVHYVQ